MKAAAAKTTKSASPKKKKAIPRPHLKFEGGAGHPSRIVIGVDEVGRGCLAGPVVAAAVALHPDWVGSLAAICRAHPELRLVTDSKLMSHEERELVFPIVQKTVRSYAIAWASVEEIDSINILRASQLAMARAADALLVERATPAPLDEKFVFVADETAPWGGGERLSNWDHVLVDGNQVPRQFAGRATTIIQGDSKAWSIACASILAKVYRDRWMARLDTEFPGYGLAAHKGYSTPQHYAALDTLGPCVLHRRSFAPIRAKLAPLLPGLSAYAKSLAAPVESEIETIAESSGAFAEFGE